MKVLLSSAAALALMTGAAMAQSIDFIGNDPVVEIDAGDAPGAAGRQLADSNVEDEQTRADHGLTTASTNNPTPSGPGAAFARSAAGTSVQINGQPANAQAELQIGNNNAAGTVQFGTNNEAATLQVGDDNLSLLMQDGNGVGTTGGGLNEAAVVQLGDMNNYIGMQLGDDNAMSAVQKGDDNLALALQSGDDNTAATLQFGNDNDSFIIQGGFGSPPSADDVLGNAQTATNLAVPAPAGVSNNNAAVAAQIGNGNMSNIFQDGNNNGAYALQCTTC